MVADDDVCQLEGKLLTLLDRHEAEELGARVKSFH